MYDNANALMKASVHSHMHHSDYLACIMWLSIGLEDSLEDSNVPRHRIVIAAHESQPLQKTHISGKIPSQTIYAPSVYTLSVSESSDRKTILARESLEALRQAALQGAIQKEKQRSPDRCGLPELDQSKSYAAPLSPLRMQDVQELAVFFDGDDMPSLEEDMLNMLDRLLPEPCWEDNPFDFLGDFIA